MQAANAVGANSACPKLCLVAIAGDATNLAARAGLGMPAIGSERTFVPLRYAPDEGARARKKTKAMMAESKAQAAATESPT